VMIADDAGRDPADSTLDAIAARRRDDRTRVAN
jgi:hypothetical protein